MKREAVDTHIYFPPEVFRDIKRLAGTHRRSISGEIVIAVEGYLTLHKPTLLLSKALFKDKPTRKRK